MNCRQDKNSGFVRQIVCRALASFCVSVVTITSIVAPTSAFAARLKDIADIEGVRGNQLFGFGIVVGLNGTGDGSVAFTQKSLSNLMEKMGIRVDPGEIKVKNVASVMVTATLPPFSRAGTKIDITLSSLGTAKSLQGGTLLLTPLKGADGNIYAVAQGAVSVGGFAVESGGDSAQKNHPTVAMVPAGASVERSIPFDLFEAQRIRVVLREPDFTTVTNITKTINDSLGRPLAVPVDAASIELALPKDLMHDPIAMLAKVENLQVVQEMGARVVINERTGTIIMGENVTISRVALAHGNLSISIRSETQVSQPNALGTGGTAVVTNSDVTVGEEKKSLSVVGGQVTLGEVVGALNALGATPRDLITIFQALKRAGALNAELVII